MTAMMMMAAIVTPVQVEKSLPLFFFSSSPDLCTIPLLFIQFFLTLPAPGKKMVR